VASTTLTLATGETLEVNGSLDDIAKQLEDATRSGAGTFAWLEDAAGGGQLCVKPAHVVTIRPGES
jgi:hypothetical protein